MTTNKALKNAIRAAQEISGLSYTEQRRGTMIAKTFTDPNSLFFGGTVEDLPDDFGLLLGFVQDETGGDLTQTDVENYIKANHLTGLFPGDTVGQIKKYGTWSGVLAHHDHSFPTPIGQMFWEIGDDSESLSDYIEEKGMGKEEAEELFNMLLGVADKASDFGDFIEQEDSHVYTIERFNNKFYQIWLDNLNAIQEEQFTELKISFSEAKKVYNKVYEYLDEIN